MKSLCLGIIAIIAAVSMTTYASAQIAAYIPELESPLQQFKSGIKAQDVRCQPVFTMIIKSSDSSPACVSPETKVKLIERGWAFGSGGISETKAILLIKEQYPELSTFPNDGLPPRVIQSEKSGAGWNIMFETLGSGIPIIDAKCFFVGDSGTVTKIGEYKNAGDMTLNLSMTCEPTTIKTETKDEFAQRLIHSNNEFAMNFYSQVSGSTDENIFFSPVSISTAFAIAYEGARTDTAKEIKTMFGFPEDNDSRMGAFQSLQNILNENNGAYLLNMANALWIQQGYDIKQEYVDAIKTYYDGNVDNVNFVTDDGVNTINDWVKSKTHDKIDRLLEPGSTDDLTRLVITNAVYFKGNWTYPFSPGWTTQADFHISPEKSVKVPMMDLDDRKLSYAKNDLLEMIELPYKGERISMLVLLPKDVDGIQSLEENITMENLSLWKKGLSETQIEVLLPKFTANTKYDLKDSLQNMGLKVPFENNADFSGISDESLYIDAAVHKAFVGVNELGTEAAAATGIEIRATSGPPATFRVDHPFVFLIQDDETGMILFMGKMVDPTK